MVKEERGKVTCPKIATVCGNRGISSLHLRPCLCRILHVAKHVYDNALLHSCGYFLRFVPCALHLLTPAFFSCCVLFVSVTRPRSLPRFASNACSSCLSLFIHGTACVCYHAQVIGFLFQMKIAVKAAHRLYLRFLLSALLVTW